MDSINYSVFFKRLKELYWTVTRALGLGFLHDGSLSFGFDKYRKRLSAAAPLAFLRHPCADSQ